MSFLFAFYLDLRELPHARQAGAPRPRTQPAELPLSLPAELSHTPKQRRTGVTKDHICQVSPDRLSDMFTEVRNSTGLYRSLPQGTTPPTYHEVHSLASDRFKRMGYDIKDVQRLMAHTDEKVTRYYQAGHGINYEEVGIYLDEQIIGGNF